MSFNEAFFGAYKSENFGQSLFIRNYKERQHISVSKTEEHEDITYMGLGEFSEYTYAGLIGKRYLGFKSIVYDLIFTVYDVNSESAFVARLYKKDQGQHRRLMEKLGRYLKSKNKPNFEARLIGLQDGEDYQYAEEIIKVLDKQKISFYEIDLFGSEVRHVAIDMRIGTTYNILLLNRVYRPGELANTLTEEQFSRNIGDQAPP